MSAETHQPACKGPAAEFEQRSLGVTCLLALVPGALMLLVPYMVAALDGLGRTLVLSSYFLVETILLFAIMRWFARRAGASFRSVLGYERAIGWPVFVVLAAFGALWAIGVRDFFRPDWVSAWAATVQGVMPEGWPSIFARLPGHDELFGGGPIVQAAGLIVGTLSVALASLAQTLYFRGFLLSGVDRLGWWAPVLITGLFVVFHMGSPPFWHVFLMLTLPWAFIAYATKNVWIVAVSHIIMNSYSGVIALLMLAAGGG